MNRFSIWTYLTVLVALIFGGLYALPNLFGESPAIQISASRTVLKADSQLMDQVLQHLNDEQIVFDRARVDNVGVKIRFKNINEQLKARESLEALLNPTGNQENWVIALNLLPATPAWLQAINALPMYLGLDLRGGVHFLMEVDVEEAVTKRLDAVTASLRSTLREQRIRYSALKRQGQLVMIRLRRSEDVSAAREIIEKLQDPLQISETAGQPLQLSVRFSDAHIQSIGENALQQNITTLRNRVDELGVSEPVVQQNGANRVIVQLPGIQDSAKAKSILGRTATLEVRLLATSGGETFTSTDGEVLSLRRDVVLTGEHLTDAQPGFASDSQEAAVFLTLDNVGAQIFKEVTRANIGQRMAILLFEKGVGEIVTAPVIRSEIGGGRVQISGSMTTVEANDIALLLRSGSLAAPMEIINERTIGPSLGASNIDRGFNATVGGLIALALFIIAYYALFGVFSTIALTVNLLLLIALLSVLQATLTLPGIAAIALTLGMAIDANVLINERIREELRANLPPQEAIKIGYDKAFATILDSNITTLIAGVALLIFGSGPVRGFAVVHTLGILTSMFSSVVVSRAMVNLYYGRQKKLKHISIGATWQPNGQHAIPQINK